MDSIEGASAASAAPHVFAHDVQLVHLADGASVRLRAAWHDDQAFQRLFFTLSDTTRYLYFQAGVPSNQTWAERFVALGHVDGPRSYALVAEVEGDLVGFACFRQGPHAGPHDHTADLGILLADAWQRRGLGSHLLTRIAQEALHRGVTTLIADVQGENRRMLGLARRAFPEIRSAWESGSCRMAIDLEAWQSSLDERMCG